jgi:hypothetical protein
MFDNSFSILNEAVKNNLGLQNWKTPSNHLMSLKKSYQQGETITWLEKELIKHYTKIKKTYGDTTNNSG